MQGIAMFLCGGFSRLGLDSTNPATAARYGDAAAAMIFLFTFVFGATWLTVPWLYPAEIFPIHVRAKGNAWGVVGWSIGNGWLVSLFLLHRSLSPFVRSTAEVDFFQTLLLPVAFAHIGEKTYYLFGIANVLSIPIVWAFYPESNQRTLEEMDLLFAADSPWNWNAEASFAKLKLERPDIVHDAQHGIRNVEYESGGEKGIYSHDETSAVPDLKS